MWGIEQTYIWTNVQRLHKVASRRHVTYSCEGLRVLNTLYVFVQGASNLENLNCKHFLF